MSSAWELISKIIANGDGDVEAFPYVQQLIDDDVWEATRMADVMPPHYTLLHKLCLYGCTRCVDLLVRHDPDLQALDQNGCTPADLARFCCWR